MASLENNAGASSTQPAETGPSNMEQSPSIRKGADELMQLFKRFRSEQQLKPAKADASAQTEHEDTELRLHAEIDRLNKKILKLTNMLPLKVDIMSDEPDPEQPPSDPAMPQEHVCEPTIHHEDMTFPQFDAHFRWDSQTLQHNDVIQDYGIDPYVDPNVLRDDNLFSEWVHPHAELDAGLEPLSPAPTNGELSLDEGHSGETAYVTAVDSPTSSDDNMEWSSPASEDELPFPPEVFTPAIRILRRPILPGSPPRPHEKGVVFVYGSPPSSPGSEQMSDG